MVDKETAYKGHLIATLHSTKPTTVCVIHTIADEYENVLY